MVLGAFFMVASARARAFGRHVWESFHWIGEAGGFEGLGSGSYDF